MAETFLQETHAFVEDFDSDSLVKVCRYHKSKYGKPYYASLQLIMRFDDSLKTRIEQYCGPTEPLELPFDFSEEAPEVFMVFLYTLMQGSLPRDFDTADGTGRREATLVKVWIFASNERLLQFQDQVMAALLRLVEADDLPLRSLALFLGQIIVRMLDARRSKLRLLMLQLLAEGFTEERFGYIELMKIADFDDFWQDMAFAQEKARQRKRMEEETERWKDFMVGDGAKEWSWA